MSLGPTVFRPRAVPFPTIGCGLIALFFVIQGIIVNRWMTVLSLAIAALFAIAACWFLFQARRSSVLIDANQFIVKTGARQNTYDIDQIENVDLSSVSGHVRFRDGSTTDLPLQGNELVEAALLLSPTAPLED
jgi:hypothetical protein